MPMKRNPVPITPIDAGYVRADTPQTEESRTGFMDGLPDILTSNLYLNFAGEAYIFCMEVILIT